MQQKPKSTLSTTATCCPTTIDKDKKNAHENLQHDRLDKQVKMKNDAQRENATLKEERNSYTKTVDFLVDVLHEKNKALQNIAEKFAAVAKKKNEVVEESEKKSEELSSDYVTLSEQNQQLLDEKKTVQCDLAKVWDLFYEADERSKEFDVLEENYEIAYEDLRTVAKNTAHYNSIIV